MLGPKGKPSFPGQGDARCSSKKARKLGQRTKPITGRLGAASLRVALFHGRRMMGDDQ